MSNLVNPLQALIEQAATLPDSKQIEQYKVRIDVKSVTTVLIVDISGSMGEYLKSGKRKINVLKSAIAPLTGFKTLAFSSDAEWVDSMDGLEPDGGTALHLAIVIANTIHPKHTLIVSDGAPDSKPQALRAAKQLSGTISTLYIGSDKDTEAIDFMNQLARQGRGTAHRQDLNLGDFALRQSVQLLLPPT